MGETMTRYVLAAAQAAFTVGRSVMGEACWKLWNDKERAKLVELK